MQDQIKEYLNKYRITSKELLEKHIEELGRNTHVDKDLIFMLVSVLDDEELFSSENKNKQESKNLVEKENKKSPYSTVESNSKEALQDIYGIKANINKNEKGNYQVDFSKTQELLKEADEHQKQNGGILQGVEFPFDTPQADWIHMMNMKRGKVFKYIPRSQKVRINFYSYDIKNCPIIEVKEFDCLLLAGSYFRESKYTEAFIYEYGTHDLIDTWQKEAYEIKKLERQEEKAIKDLDSSSTKLLQDSGILSSAVGGDYFGIVEIKSCNSPQGKKETDEKTDYTEIDWSFIEGLAKRMNKNKEKYELFNYQKPMDIELLKQSLLRHTLEIMKGNYNDDGQDLGHFYAIALNSMMIVWQIKNNKLGYIK